MKINTCFSLKIASQNVTQIILLPRFQPELQEFARGLAHIGFLQNKTFFAINKKVIWQAKFLTSRKQAQSCNNSGETEEV